MSMLCVKRGSKEVQKAPRELFHIGTNVDDQTFLPGILSIKNMFHLRSNLSYPELLSLKSQQLVIKYHMVAQNNRVEG